MTGIFSVSLPGIALTLAPAATSLLVDSRVSVGDRGKFDVNQGNVAQRFVALIGDGRVSAGPTFDPSPFNAHSDVAEPRIVLGEPSSENCGE
jgi:hypothetical protein